MSSTNLESMFIFAVFIRDKNERASRENAGGELGFTGISRCYEIQWYVFEALIVQVPGGVIRNREV